MKTPEEAAREYAKKIWKNGRAYRSRIGYSAEDFLAGYVSAIAKVGEAQKWISVEDKLPVVGKNGISDTVLVFDGSYHCASYCKNKYYPQGAWFDPAMDLPIDVTHWRLIELLKTQEYETDNQTRRAIR